MTDARVSSESVEVLTQSSTASAHASSVFVEVLYKPRPVVEVSSLTVEVLHKRFDGLAVDSVTAIAIAEMPAASFVISTTPVTITAPVMTASSTAFQPLADKQYVRTLPEVILAMNPRYYFPLNESSGTAIANLGAENTDGVAYGSPEFNQRQLLIGSSPTSTKFDGVDDVIKVISSEMGAYLDAWTISFVFMPIEGEEAKDHGVVVTNKDNFTHSNTIDHASSHLPLLAGFGIPGPYVPPSLQYNALSGVKRVFAGAALQLDSPTSMDAGKIQKVRWRSNYDYLTSAGVWFPEFSWIHNPSRAKLVVLRMRRQHITSAYELVFDGAYWTESEINSSASYINSDDYGYSHASSTSYDELNQANTSGEIRIGGPWATNAEELAEYPATPGKGDGTLDEFFLRGYMSDLAIWDRALTVSEQDRLHQASELAQSDKVIHAPVAVGSAEMGDSGFTKHEPVEIEVPAMEALAESFPATPGYSITVTDVATATAEAFAATSVVMVVLSPPVGYFYFNSELLSADMETASIAAGQASATVVINTFARYEVI